MVWTRGYTAKIGKYVHVRKRLASVLQEREKDSIHSCYDRHVTSSLPYNTYVSCASLQESVRSARE